MDDIQSYDVVEHHSSLSFDVTLARVIERIKQAGMTLFAVIDHGANARLVGMTMPSAKVLIYGNPKGGTPVMLASPLAALDLPLRVLVQERADGKVVIAFHPITTALMQVGVSREEAAKLAPAQKILAAVTSP